MERPFFEDSPQNSAKPQASSTLMISKTDTHFKGIDDDSSLDFPKPTERSGTSGLSATSSLGVIDIEKQSLFSDKDDSILSKLKESFNSDNFIEEQSSISLGRFRKRIDDIFDNTRNNKFPSSKKANGILKISSNSFEPAKNDNPSVSNSFRSPSRTSFLSNLSHVSDFNFESGKSAVQKLEADQKENRKMYDSLPVSPINISENSDNVDEREEKFSQLVKMRCYTPDQIAGILRNNLDVKSRRTSNISVASNKPMETQSSKSIYVTSTTCATSKPDNKFSKIPKRFGYKDQHTSTKIIKPCIEVSSTTDIDEKHSKNNVKHVLPSVFADSMFSNDSYEESAASSIASINQIAETLRRQSLMAEPRRAIEHLLSIGKSRPKFTPSVSTSKPIVNKNDCSSAFASLNTTEVVTTEVDVSPTFTTCDSEPIKTPSTLTCPARQFCVDSVTGKVHGVKNISFNCANESIRSDSKPSFNTIAKSEEKNETKTHFYLVQTSSPLNICDKSDEQDVSMFLKLNPENELIDSMNASLNSTSNLIKAYKKEMNELTRNYSTSSKLNTTAKPVRRISSNHNVTNASVNDLTSVERTGDMIDAGTLCLGTQVEVIIAIENPTPDLLRYKMTLKSIVVNGKMNLSAASVLLVSNNEDIIFLPKAVNEIKIMVSPLILGKIDVILEFVSEEKNFSNICRRIVVTGEQSKVKLEQPENNEIQFGLLTEQTVKHVPLIIKNESLCRIPLKFSIQQADQIETFVARTILDPCNTFKCDVCVNTHEMSFDLSTAINLRGKLVVQLDTSEETILNKSSILYTISLSAIVGKMNLLVNDGVALIVKCSPLANHTTSHLKVKNTGVLPLDLTVRTNEMKIPEFAIEPTNFMLLPNHQKYLKINFKPITNIKSREVDVRFVEKNTNKIFYLKVTGTIESDMVWSSSTTAPYKYSRENCVTPKSGSSGSSNGADGPIELDCTHECVSWGSVPLHSKNIQTITLRNRNTQLEKLLLTISDVSGTFKFVENEFYDKELKLTLEPKESRKISIVFIPYVADQATTAKVVITRRHTLETSSSDVEKRVIPLYGVGGQIKILYSGIFRDNENRLWITPDSDTFEANFTIENAGDSVAFVKLISEDPDDELIPEDIILLPAESVELNYTLHLNKDRLDVLYKQNPSKEVLLANKLLVFCGNESTRLRLKKLWSRYKDIENMQRIRGRLETLVDMNSCNRVQVDSLFDSQSALNKLWFEGVTEQTIGILIPRHYLESTCLDSTIVFKNLNNNTIVPEF